LPHIGTTGDNVAKILFFNKKAAFTVTSGNGSKDTKKPFATELGECEKVGLATGRRIAISQRRSIPVSEQWMIEGMIDDGGTR